MFTQSIQRSRTLLIALLLAFMLGGWLQSPTAAIAQAESPTGEPGYWYDVQRGDSWSKVASTTGVPIQALWDANPDKINRRLWLYIGDRIWIPTAGTCPATADYDAEILTYLNSPGATPAGLESWLSGCGVLSAYYLVALDGVIQDDIALIIDDVSSGSVIPSSQLLVYHGSAGSYYSAYHVANDSQLEILDISDINLDGRREITWTETYCGAHTCVSTLQVDRWSGEQYDDWVIGSPSMASAEFGINTAGIAFPYNEIVISGGFIGSVGAGPQRGREELYLFSPGTPYYLSNTVYQPSDCIYHHIVDANDLFNRVDGEGGDYAFAIAAYEAILADSTLTECPWVVMNQVDTLRDFARFRLLVAHAAQGDLADGVAYIGDIVNTDIGLAADTFAVAFSSASDLDAACAAVTTFAESNPASWDYLADWGYANPPFAAESLCAGAASISGVVWNDACSVSADSSLPPSAGCADSGGVLQANGIREAGEAAIYDIAVTLYQDTCAASGSVLNMASTGINGDYRFDQLTSGDYCLEISLLDSGNDLRLIPGGWTHPAAGDADGSIRVDVAVAPGQSVLDIDFGWDFQFD